MLIARWVIGSLLACLWLLLIVCFIGSVIQHAIKKDSKGVSLVPFIGSLLGLGALLVLPIGIVSQRLFFLPLALLPDVPFIVALPMLFRELRKNRKGRP